MRSVLRWSAVWTAAAALAACGDDSASTSDSGVEAGPDASMDGTFDAPAEAAEASPDASKDGPGDVATEASKEASVDGSMLADGSSEGAIADATADSGVPLSVIAEPGYSVTLWATGTADYFNPDSIDYDGAHYWVGFQNQTTKDGSDGGPGFGTTSTIVEYSVDGGVLAKYSIPGHNDGLRFDPVGHKVWATSNEDGSPHLVSIDPSVVDASAAVVEYTILQAADAAAAAHGGGYDDLRFVNGNLYVAASNPSGTHVQSIDLVTINGTTATFSPVFYNDSPAVPVGGDAQITLALTDPDSMAIDNQGRLVLVSQADSQLIFISNLGMPSQSASVLQLATQPEDPVWITKATGPADAGTPAPGRMLLVDGTANAIYEIHASFTVGTVFTETPNDSTIPGLLATVDPTTGVLVPKIVGFGKPTGLIFVPSP